MKITLQKPAFMVEATQMKKHAFKLIVEILIFLAIFSVASMIQTFIILGPQLYWMLKDIDWNYVAAQLSSGNYMGYLEAFTEMLDMPSWLLILQLFSTVGCIIVTILYCKVIEKRPKRTLGLTKDRIIPEYLIGLLVGFGAFTAGLLICVLTGSLEITGLSKNLNIGVILLFFLGYVVQGASEEILFRGYLMPALTKKHSLVFAIVINSVLFALFHIGNPNISLIAIVNLFLFGVLASVYTIKRGNLWGVCAVHTMWNFTQGNIFGVQVSGLKMSDSIFTSQFDPSMKFINGGAFGLEGGIAETFVLIVAIMVLLFMKGKDVACEN